MKRFFWILLLLLLVLVGCGGAGLPVATLPEVEYPANFLPLSSDVAPLTQTQIEEIEEAWCTQNGYPLKWFDRNDLVTWYFGWRYYGQTDGYVILARPGHSPACVTIGTERINATVAIELYAYAEGELIPLPDGEFEGRDLSAAVEAHKAYEEWLREREDRYDPYSYENFSGTDLEPCPYSEDSLAQWGIPYTSDYYTYCGTYHGCIVFRVMTLTTVVDDEKWIGGVTIDRGNDCFLVYRDGQRYYLEEAFEYGYLTWEDIKTIAYHYYGEEYPFEPG